MTNKFSQYVTRQVVISPKRYDVMASFCHFDAKNQIADYVVHYLKSLSQAGADIYFVSNCPQIADSELDKIKPFVAQIILRKNIGYDFGCYFTGYAYAANEGYKTVTFVNDSCYGPFYQLGPLYERMKEFDMWGISDAYAGRYHIQSNFWVFNNMKDFLDKEAETFKFISIKEQVVGRYEEGISQKIIAYGYKVGVLCDNKLIAEFEKQSTDPILIRLKSNIKEIAAKKINFARRIKAFFCPWLKKKNHKKVYEHASLTGIFSCWYAAVKYFDCPLIKVGLLKRPVMEKYHEGEYINLLKEKYPDYDVNMILRHLGKI